MDVIQKYVVMYRIKQDKRVAQSANLIVMGLYQCLKSKNISEISVSELCGASTVSRSTFYRLFDSPVDVLSYVCDSLVEEISSDMASHRAMSKDKRALHTLRFLMDRCDFLELLFRSGRLDIMEQTFNNLREVFIPESTLTEREARYIYSSMIGALCSILMVWMRNGRKESAQELLDLYSGFIYSHRM